MWNYENIFWEILHPLAPSNARRIFLVLLHIRSMLKNNKVENCQQNSHDFNLSPLWQKIIQTATAVLLMRTIFGVWGLSPPWKCISNLSFLDTHDMQIFNYFVKMFNRMIMTGQRSWHIITTFTTGQICDFWATIKSTFQITVKPRFTGSLNPIPQKTSFVSKSV